MGKIFGLRVLAVLTALVLVASSVAMYGYNGADVEKGISEGGGKGVFSLEAPSFVSIASARGGGGGAGAGGGGAFPEDEAGISSYINTSQTISIEKIKTIFTVVEEVGDNYIIGITPISDYGGNMNVHMYADTDGWIVAYIKNDEPASKIMQWGTADVNDPVITTITTTTLRDALYKAGDAAGVGIVSTKIKYYDFEYPNANGMTLFIRTRPTIGTNITQVEIPATYTLYEASYYHYVRGGIGPNINQWANSNLKVDETAVSTSPNMYGQWWRAFDSYKGAITTGTLHKIEISYDHYIYPSPHSWEDDTGSAGVATVLIYKTA